jgi:hypothetical protein
MTPMSPVDYAAGDPPSEGEDDLLTDEEDPMHAGGDLILSQFAD